MKDSPLMNQAKDTATMTLPIKCARPLKKRRFVSIEPEEEVVDDTRSQSSDDDSRSSEAKRVRTAASPLPSLPSSPATASKKTLTWNDRGGNLIHVRPDPAQLFPSFNASDLWYTTTDYQEFLLDRLKTIESHRFFTANNIRNDNSKDHCIRGLELFHDDTSNEEFQTKKKLFHSTIKNEQLRQTILGIKDPERFRELVSSQSDLALHRAQELAARDAREAYSARELSSVSELTRKPLRRLSSSSLSDMKRLGNMMESIYGSGTSRDTISWDTAPVSESGSASVVSDASSTGSTESSSGNNYGQSIFADESIRKLQERSMRRLMGIYQNKGNGAQRSSETNSLFKFARRDSLLGLRNNNPDTNNASNASGQNSTWAVPQPENKAPSPQEQLLELLRQRQLLQEQHEQQQQQVEGTGSLEEQLVEILRQRELLQEHLRQQQLASAKDAAPSLQEQLMETMERRQMLEGHGQQRQAPDNTIGTRLIDEFLLQQKQHQEDHKNKMKLAWMAMGASRIRRDTLSHVNTNHNEVGIDYQTLPWSLSSTA